jgi:hypothetical protein
MGGWEPAVDNLQSEINAVNSQISTLSGQIGSQTPTIALLTGQLSALQTEVAGIQQQVANGSLLADLSGVTLSNVFNAQSILSINGSSVLSVPASAVVDGKPFRLTVLGRVVNNAQTSFYGALLLGTSIQPGMTLVNNSASAGAASFNGLFYFEMDFVWDATTKKLFGLHYADFSQRTDNSYISGSTSAIGNGGPQGGMDVATQAGLQFVFTAQWNTDAPSNPASIVLNQFKLTLI